MKVVISTDEYTVYRKRNERYAVRNTNKKWVNGDEKIEILLNHALIETAMPKGPAPAEESVEETPAEEVEAPAEESIEETPAEEVEAPAEESVEETPAEEVEAPAEESEGDTSTGDDEDSNLEEEKAD